MDATETTRPTRLMHPTWCHPGLCKVRPSDHSPTSLVGEHIHQVWQRLRPATGGLVVVDIRQEEHEPEPDIVVLCTYDDGAEGYRMALQAEEARQLARYLLEVADAWEVARRG